MGGSTYYSENAYLETCRLTIASGTQHDLKEMVIEMSYHEDIFSFSTSGYITLRDGVGLIQAFQLSGKETLELRFDKSQNEYDDTPIQKFIVYKIGERRPTGNMNSEFYKLYFCTHDMFFNEQIRVSKSYKGKKIHDMVDDILTQYLKTKTKIYTQETTGVYDFIIPMLRPYEAISWLSNYARPNVSGKTGFVGADMFLFQNRYGYTFNSLNALMSVPAYKKLKYQQNNLDPDVETLQAENDSVLGFEIVRSFDSMKAIASGAYANKVIAVDLLTKSQDTKKFNYASYLQEIPPENGASNIPDITNPMGQTPNQAYNSKVKVVITNSGQKNVGYIKENGVDSVGQDVYMQETLSLRMAQVSLLNSTVIKVIVPGDANLTVGKTIDFNYYSLTLGDSRSLDPFYSGKYLITAARHIIQSQGVYQTVLELCKDSSTQQYASTNTTTEG
jgi:hypothetical protein